MFWQSLTKPLCRGNLLTRLIVIGAVGLFGVSAYAQSGVFSFTGVEPTPGADRTEDHDNGDDCDLPPVCRFPIGEVLYINSNEVTSFSFVLQIDGRCPESDDLFVELFLNGQLNAFGVVPDGVGPQDVGIRGEDFLLQPGESMLLLARVTDLEIERSSECTLLIVGRCDAPPWCSFNGAVCDEARDGYAMAIYDVQPGDILPVLEFCAHSQCGNRARVEMFARPPFMDPIGHRKGGHGERVCISTRANDIVESGFAEGTYWAKFKCTDVRNGRHRVLKVGFRYTDPPEEEACDEPPVCEVYKSSGGLISGPMITVTIPVGDSMTLFVCGSSACDDCDIAIAVTGAGLPFVSLSDTGVPHPAGLVGTCDAYVASPTENDAAGIHLASFTVTDCFGTTTECVVRINVFHPAPLLACTENEDQFPNDSFADASVIDSGACADEFGVNIYGVLDAPVATIGDVDYYRIVGLTPGEVYNATIVAGLNPDNGFTDTMLGWIVADGVAIATDDDSGPLEGYSKITFTADADGVATLAITGHGDDDFDGSMDASMPYEEYGFGGYMLSIRAVDGDAMPIEQQADLNGDGVVDTGDLGMLIGLFGVTN